jgi:hypothetical protein
MIYTDQVARVVWLIQNHAGKLYGGGRGGGGDAFGQSEGR